MHEITQLLNVVISWPIVVLLFLFLFKSQIANLLARTRRVGWGYKAIEFGEAKVDVALGKKPSLPKRASSFIKSSTKNGITVKPATIFWLGNDIMWLQDMLLRNAPREAILAGLTNAASYAADLGLSESFVTEEINRLEQLLHLDAKEQEVPLIGSQREALASRIETIKWALASRIESNQPKFTKRRVFIKSA